MQLRCFCPLSPAVEGLVRMERQLAGGGEPPLAPAIVSRREFEAILPDPPVSEREAGNLDFCVKSPIFLMLAINSLSLNTVQAKQNICKPKSTLSGLWFPCVLEQSLQKESVTVLVGGRCPLMVLSSGVRVWNQPQEA